MTVESEREKYRVFEQIYVLPIPTPFAIGRVNTYLIEDEPLTLIDSGPNSGKSLDELERQLGAIGYRIEDIELLILTHQHLDHIGLADIIAKRSGAQVAGIGVMADLLANYSKLADLDDKYAMELMHRYGIPDDIVHALAAVSQSFRGWGADVELTSRLADGDTVKLANHKFEVLWRPGHSPSDTVFWEQEKKLLVAGDHLLAAISSNPLIHRPLDPQAADEGPRPQALVTYIESLEKTRELPAELVLTGHGEAITNHRSLIDERFQLHKKRAEKIYGLIAEGSKTAYGVAQEIWGNVAVTQAFLTLSEVVGHTDILLNEGRIVEKLGSDGVVLFTTTHG